MIDKRFSSNGMEKNTVNGQIVKVRAKMINAGITKSVQQLTKYKEMNGDYEVKR